MSVVLNRQGLFQRPTPPLVFQKGVTCWAAALASWLQAARGSKWSFDEVMAMYKPYARDNGGLDRANLDYVTESLFVRMDYEDVLPAELTADYLSDLLRWSHLYIIMAIADGISHAVVLYGMSGRDNEIHAMDPQFGYRAAPLAEFQKIGRRYLVGYKKGRYGMISLDQYN